MTYLEFLYLPFPDRTFFDLLTFNNSSATPNFSRVAKSLLVLPSEAIAASTTSGSSGTLSTLCPLAMTNGVQAEAARADETAWRLWVILALACHFLQISSGANI